MRKICIFTSSRADYDLLSNLGTKLRRLKNIKVIFLVTGTHLSRKHGFFLNTIKKEHKIIFQSKLNINSDKRLGVIKAFSSGVDDYGKLLKKINPDIFLVLGDRFEAFAASISANILKIPIAHISGGEVTEGAMDDAFRHSITKLSNIHFVAHSTYKKRVIQLGENKKNIFVVGGTGPENVREVNFINKKSLEKNLKLKFLKRNLLVTIHPETVNEDNNKKILSSLLPALKKLSNTLVIFTAPNIDPGNKIFYKKILQLVKQKKNFKYFKSLGKQKYFSCIRYCDAVIGNSSSGITEVPSMKKFTINIGDRQKGRLFAKSIINTKLTEEAIKRSIKKVYDTNFYKKFYNLKNPYDKSKTSFKIAKVLKSIKLNKLYNKKFFDIK